jgi:2-succinyl-6-hydroxy-2,4-cyclohexadiene-1-carboxylate synthase
MRGMAPTIVLLHGFTHTGASWQPVIEALGERYRAIAPDLRGHGTASERDPVTLDAVVQDVGALTAGPFTLVGYSMGGRIALHVALALGGSRVTRLVLIGTSPGLADDGQRRERVAADEALAREVERISIEEFAHRWADTPVLAGQPASVRRAVDQDRLRNAPAGLARALRGLGTGALPPLWDRLSELSMPVTLIVGERDAKFRAIAEDMASGLPRARVVVVPDSGHAVHLEAPVAVVEALGVSVNSSRNVPRPTTRRTS